MNFFNTHTKSAICNPQSAICTAEGSIEANPQSAPPKAAAKLICQSANLPIRNPQSANL
jgi:hypothetical protein